MVDSSAARGGGRKVSGAVRALPALKHKHIPWDTTRPVLAPGSPPALNHSDPFSPQFVRIALHVHPVYTITVQINTEQGAGAPFYGKQ